MKIVCISDTHNFHDNLIIPKGDIIIHAGDFTEAGTKREVKNFFNWFAKLPFQHKVCIAGNHDFLMENINSEELAELIPKGVNYLHNSSVEIEGINFFGSPYIGGGAFWAFSSTNTELEKHWDKIPKKTDVLITHTPPYDVLDEGLEHRAIGCRILAEKVEQIQPKYHIFGHVHENYGKVKLNDITYINATSLYRDLELTNAPIVFDY